MVETALKAVLNKPGEAPALTLTERDRRYGIVRAALRERGIDALIVTGTDLLYLSGGVSGEEYGLLPTEPGEAFEVVVAWRWLVDLPAETLIASQEWVERVRSGRDASPLVECIEELRLHGGTIGYAGPMSHAAMTLLAGALPLIELVDVSGILMDVRTIKSGEEIALIDRANRIFDAAVEAVHREARPGMLGRDAVRIGLQAMWEAGGDPDSTFLLNFGAEPAQNPVLADMCLNLPIRDGDIATLTAHSRYHYYSGHSDQEIVFGDPKQRHLDMFEGVRNVREAVLDHVREGVTMREVIDAYEIMSREAGYLPSGHSQIHQYGINVPEFPGPSFRLPDAKGGRGLAGGGNYTLQSGMIFSISPTLIDEASGETLLAGNSLAVTEDGYRQLGTRGVELLVAA